MANDTGMIVVTQFTNDLGVTERLEYKWEGPPVVAVTHDLLEEMASTIYRKYINMGPFRLRLIDIDYRGGVNYYVRVDSPTEVWHGIAQKVKKLWQMIIAR